MPRASNPLRYLRPILHIPRSRLISQASNGRDMSSSGFAARAQGAGDRNVNAAGGSSGTGAAKGVCGLQDKGGNGGIQGGGAGVKK
ncbi:uncharacterized protein LY89DRAFT_22039 [Mollisia scopiformis]|uniref:Uncharacterized protein n=1 Tax=Mollisia scopiformis TaxID=149040 RepID=A0A194XWK5_MOLSC|nr:uncharacterized protein LY89DRAFT_22039 [Mollisia scopiformis]KUJ24404.1 hypothetical protein LY89DRAFT_22039 [Mollisia scopiformis]